MTPQQTAWPERDAAGRRSSWGLAGLLIICLSILVPPPASADERGKAVYKKANCVGCHKWHGAGGGGYGGAALSLREMELTREQFLEVVRCGRPATRMPYHDRRAWKKQMPCFEMTRQEIGSDAPPKAAKLLRPEEIDAVADYVYAAVVGKGEPTKAECVAFWGEDARECTRF